MAATALLYCTLIHAARTSLSQRWWRRRLKSCLRGSPGHTVQRSCRQASKPAFFLSPLPPKPESPHMICLLLWLSALRSQQRAVYGVYEGPRQLYGSAAFKQRVINARFQPAGRPACLPPWLLSSAPIAVWRLLFRRRPSLATSEPNVILSCGQAEHIRVSLDICRSLSYEAVGSVCAPR